MLALPPFHRSFFPFQKLVRHRPLSHSSSTATTKMTSLLHLNDDILQTIFEKILNPVIVAHNKRIPESAITNAIPLASTCTRLMSIFSRSLSDLELWTTANITDDGLAFLCTRGASHIKRLVLRGCNRLHSSFHYIAHCQAIRTLDLSCVVSLDDAILTRICQGIGNTVRSLLLRRCVRLTDQSISVVAETCTQLRALDLGGLTQLTDTAVEHLARLRSASLQILVLSWCPLLTDKCLQALAITNLQAVFLRGLRISNVGVEAMIQGIGGGIEALDLLDCPNVSNSVFTGCLQRCPKLRGHLLMADDRSVFQNCVTLLKGYAFIVVGEDDYRQVCTVVCVLDAGSANAFTFHILSGEALTFDSDEAKIIATNCGVTITRRTRAYLKRSFGIEV